MLAPQIVMSLGRALRSHPATNMRVSVTPVKTEVMMPITSTTAKPFTGPEPKANSATPEMTLVRFASQIARLASL